MYLSQGDGSFRQDTAFQFGSGDRLFTDDGCYHSTPIDMTADGLHDVLRFAGATQLDGSPCKVSSDGISHVFVNGGDGRFTPRQLRVKGLADSEPRPIKLERRKSTDLEKDYCDPPPMGAPQPQGMPGCRVGKGWTYGAAFFLIDLNADGRPDLVTTTLPYQPPQDPMVFGVVVNSCPAGTVCSRVYIDDGTGLLVERASNINGLSLYADPGVASDYQYIKHIGNVDGDLLPDLVSVGKLDSAGHWRSTGDGQFERSIGSAYCERPLDTNGDGRVDCLWPSRRVVEYNSLYVSQGTLSAQVADFNLNVPGTELEPDPALVPVGKRYGHFIIDLNADARDDIFRWHDDPAQNKLFLANGDGTYRDATLSGYQITRFASSDGKLAVVQADFLGTGTPQLLRLSDQAPAAGDNYSITNNLYMRPSPLPADRLLQVSSSTGLVTRLEYAFLPTAPAGRYTSDRGGAYAARYPTIDLLLPLPVVTAVEADTGAGAARTRTEYAYLGLKADLQGLGVLGMRELRLQTPAPNGQALTTATQFHLRRPYAGVARRTESRLASLGSYNGADTLSLTINKYCDTTSSTPPANATEATPCATDAKVTRPYLHQSIESGYDIDAARTALPKVTTTYSFDDFGNPLTVAVRTEGQVAGVQRTYEKLTTNEYTSSTGGDYWILGRLRKASVKSTVPSLNLAPEFGTAPYAGWTDGGGVIQDAIAGQTGVAAPAPSAAA